MWFPGDAFKNDLSANLDNLSFIATLSSGLSKVGTFVLPEIRIQKIPRPRSSATSATELHSDLSRTLDSQVSLAEKIEVASARKKLEAKTSEEFSVRENHLKHWKDRLKSFLNGSTIYELPIPVTPEVSIIIPVRDRAELTYACLLSIISSAFFSYEVIIVDNASSDCTPQLLAKFKGVRIINSNENLHYLRGINFGSRNAKGKYLLFLNNDVILDPGAISSAVKTLSSSNDIGAVGGRLISMDGSLQEAGSVLLKDGASYAYGIGEDPWNYRYLFTREVDYCSGSFLLTPKQTFSDLGCFDPRYAPAYYEEVDYCVRLKKQGMKVVYQPRSVVFHLEHGSATKEEAVKAQTQNRKIFASLQADFLENAPNMFDSILRLGRNIGDSKKKVLFVDDRVPFMEAGCWPAEDEENNRSNCRE